MTNDTSALHPVFAAGRAAVVTGAAGAIGRAACKRFAALGMHVCMTDIDVQSLASARTEVSHEATGGDVLAIPADVAQVEDLVALNDTITAAYGAAAVLMNNAVARHSGHCLGDIDNWHKTLDVGLWGVINACQAFVPQMAQSGQPGLVINAGSKQGITNPPGRPHYNVAKAAVKTYTELLEHELRNTEGAQTTAHLLVPGFTRDVSGKPGDKRPAGAWSPEQLIDFMMPALAAGNFYIVCPDNEVTPAMDRTRILWASGDITQNRPALSRWHPDFKDAFDAFKP